MFLVSTSCLILFLFSCHFWLKKIKDPAGTPKTGPCYCLKLSIFFPESNNTVRQRNLNFLALLETFPLTLPSIDLCIPLRNDSHQLDLEKNGKAPIIASLLLSYMVLMRSIILHQSICSRKFCRKFCQAGAAQEIHLQKVNTKLRCNLALL